MCKLKKGMTIVMNLSILYEGRKIFKEMFACYFATVTVRVS